MLRTDDTTPVFTKLRVIFENYWQSMKVYPKVYDIVDRCLRSEWVLKLAISNVAVHWAVKVDLWISSKNLPIVGGCVKVYMCVYSCMCIFVFIHACVYVYFIHACIFVFIHACIYV